VSTEAPHVFITAHHITLLYILQYKNYSSILRRGIRHIYRKRHGNISTLLLHTIPTVLNLLTTAPFHSTIFPTFLIWIHIKRLIN